MVLPRSDDAILPHTTSSGLSPSTGETDGARGLRFEVEYAEEYPSTGRARQPTVGHKVDVIGDVHVELEFIRETAIKRPRERPVQHTDRQKGGNSPLAAIVGDEAVLAAVLEPERASGDHVFRERRWIVAWGLEDRDPSRVLTVGDQSR